MNGRWEFEPKVIRMRDGKTVVHLSYYQDVEAVDFPEKGQVALHIAIGERRTVVICDVDRELCWRPGEDPVPAGEAYTLL